MIRLTFKYLLMLVVLGMLTGVTNNTVKAQELPKYNCDSDRGYPESEKPLGYDAVYVACAFEGPIDEPTLRSWAERIYNVDLGRKHQNLVIGWKMYVGSDGDKYFSDFGMIKIKDGAFEPIETPKVRTREEARQWLQRDLDEKLLRYLKEYEARSNKNPYQH